MRRNISLYIGEELVDLDDQSLILYNWTMEDLSNPTVVKNSYSQTVTLQGTPQNNRIFGACFRVDRRIMSGSSLYTGVGFDPTRKTPFTIYSETSEILQSGYVKLNSVLLSGAQVQYNITLYGGLGSFFYALSYDAQGNKRTLADLDYLETGNSDTELDFDITAASVEAAWSALQSGVSGKWQVVNFAPCYNGIPDGDFSADKAVAMPSSIGLSDTQTDGDDTYGTKSGYSLINLAQEHDEWAVKDLRSYLQRPVFSMESFFEAICRPENNGGYNVDVSSLVREGSSSKLYHNIWMTLPMLTELNLSQTEIDGSITMNSPWTTSQKIASYSVTSSSPIPANTDVTAKVHVRMQLQSGSAINETLYTSWQLGNIVLCRIFFIQLVAYSGNYMVGGSKVACISDAYRDDLGVFSPEYMASRAKYTPQYITDGENMYESATRQCEFVWDESVYLQNIEMEFSSTGQQADRFDLMVSCYNCVFEPYNSSALPQVTGAQYPPDLFRATGTVVSITGLSVMPSSDDSVTIEIPDGEIRSGAHITKQVLLSTEHTPAEYLLSFCKMYGLYFIYDSPTKNIRIVTRNDLYSEASEVIDLSDRIDLSQDREIVPFVFESKWYDFALESDGGEFWDNYKSQYGVEYGIQRVDTGYDFEADNINLMDGNVFRNAATVLERSPYFNRIRVVNTFIPSVFVDKGNTYTLWNVISDPGEGRDSKEFGISNPPDSADVTYLNPDYEGYDALALGKMQFHDADGKPLDGAGVLVQLVSYVRLTGWYGLSDDTPQMVTLNDGKPCWILKSHYSDEVVLPMMRRCIYSGSDPVMDKSLDFGRARELSIPGVRYPDDDCTLYELYWKKYLTDRYDNDTKILRCRVDLSGLPVGQDLLRRFFWYDNQRWVLNKITNYSYTTYDTAECEFIQVQDEQNYINGQTLK